MQNRNSFVLCNTLSQKSVKKWCVTALLQLNLPADSKLLPCLWRIYSLAEEKGAKRAKMKDTSTQRRGISGCQFGTLDWFIKICYLSETRKKLDILIKKGSSPSWMIPWSYRFSQHSHHHISEDMHCMLTLQQNENLELMKFFVPSSLASTFISILLLFALFKVDIPSLQD